VTAGVLTVNGTAGNDTASLSDAGAVLTAKLGGSSMVFFSPPVTSAVLNGNDGNDTLTYTSSTRAGQVFGGNGNDTITGSVVSDSLDGGANDDSIVGGLGNDTIIGGEGSDALIGGTGNDNYVFNTAAGIQTDTITELTAGGTDLLNFASITTPVTVNLTSNTALATMTNRTVKTALAGQAAFFENVTGGSGNDTITGNVANNTIVGGAGNDVVVGGAGNDSIDGGSGNDSLTGDAGDDVLVGGEGNDTAVGGANNDTYIFNAGAVAQTDTVVELTGGGTDVLNFASLSSTVPVTVNLTSDASLASHTNRTVKTALAGQAAFFENVIAGSGNDTITGNNANNSVFGGAGNDVIVGGLGNDTLRGGLGNDILTGSTGFDQLFGEDGNDTLFGADTGAKDTLDGGAGTDSLGSSDTVDVLVSIP